MTYTLSPPLDALPSLPATTTVAYNALVFELTFRQRDDTLATAYLNVAARYGDDYSQADVDSNYEAIFGAGYVDLPYSEIGSPDITVRVPSGAWVAIRPILFEKWYDATEQ